MAARQVPRTRLAKRGRTGVTRFRAVVDAGQVARQVATRPAVKGGIVTHRATRAA